MSDLYCLDIRKLVDTYNLKAFIETGSGDCQGPGAGLLEASKYGLELFSCDLNAQFAEMCRAKFPSATIMNLDSRDYLREVLPKVDVPTLFWLDAHFPEVALADGTKEQNFPMMEELKLIQQLKSNYQNDVILCDDMHTCNVPDNPMYTANMEPIGYNEYTIAYHKNMFADTHDCELLQVEFGILMYTPKKVA